MFIVLYVSNFKWKYIVHVICVAVELIMYMTIISTRILSFKFLDWTSEVYLFYPDPCQGICIVKKLNCIIHQFINMELSN